MVYGFVLFLLSQSKNFVHSLSPSSNFILCMKSSWNNDQYSIPPFETLTLLFIPNQWCVTFYILYFLTISSVRMGFMSLKRVHLRITFSLKCKVHANRNVYSVYCSILTLGEVPDTYQKPNKYLLNKYSAEHLRQRHILYILSHCSHVQLCNPMDCNLPGTSVHGTLQARILEWVAMPFSRGSSHILYTYT